MEDDGRLSFVADLENDKALKKADELVDSLRNIGQVATKEGETIDKNLSQKAADGLSRVAETASDAAKKMSESFTTVVEKGKEITSGVDKFGVKFTVITDAARSFDEMGSSVDSSASIIHDATDSISLGIDDVALSYSQTDQSVEDSSKKMSGATKEASKSISESTSAASKSVSSSALEIENYAQKISRMSDEQRNSLALLTDRARTVSSEVGEALKEVGREAKISGNNLRDIPRDIALRISDEGTLSEFKKATGEIDLAIKDQIAALKDEIAKIDEVSGKNSELIDSLKKQRAELNVSSDDQLLKIIDDKIRQLEEARVAIEEQLNEAERNNNDALADELEERLERYKRDLDSLNNQRTQVAANPDNVRYKEIDEQIKDLTESNRALIEKQRELNSLLSETEKVKGFYNEMVRQNSSLQSQLKMARNEMEQMIAPAVKSGDSMQLAAVKSSARYKELQSIVKNVTDSLRDIQNAGSSNEGPTRFFASEDDYNRVQDLTTQIEILQSKIKGVTNPDEKIALTGQLIELRQELDELNSKAEEAASDLGEKMGKRAADASASLYELNRALDATEKEYDELWEAADKAEKELAEANESGDSEKIKKAQEEYEKLATSLREVSERYGTLKAKQKDAQSDWDSVSKNLGEVEGNFGRVAGSVSQLTRTLTVSKNPIAIFRASLTALRGGMKLVELGAGGIKSALLSLWKVMLANPFTAVAVGLAAVTAGIIALVNSTKNATEKLIELYSAQKAHADAMKNAADQRFSSQEEVISGLENELAIMKAQHKSLAEIRAKEDELNKKRKEYAKENQYNYAGYTKNVEEYRKGIAEAEKEIGRLKEIQIREDNEDETVKYKIDGREMEGDADKAIEALQAYIATRTIWISLGVKGREDEKKANLEKAQQDRERLEQNREIADAETSAKRAAVNAEISLTNDAYAREVAAAEQASTEKIEDLKKRLHSEETLTAEARKAINDNIVSEEKALEQKLAKLKYDHEKQILDIRRQVEDTKAPVGELTQDQQLSALRQTYDRLIEDVQDKIKNKDILGLSPEQVAKYEELYNAYLDRKSREEALFAKKREVTEIETEKATLDLRLAAVKQNSEEEYRLRSEMIEKERQAEIAANKLLAEDQQMDENLINDKYYRQQNDLYKEYLTNMDSEYRQWLGGIDALTVVELEKLLKESKKALNELLSRKLSGDISVDQSEIDALMAKIEELENRIKNANLSPKQRDAEYWRKIASYVNDLGNSFKDLGDAIEGATGQVVSFVGEAITSVGNTINAVTDGIEKAAETTSTALKVVESASVVLTVISSAISLVRGLVSLFDDSDEQAERAAQATKHYQNAVAALRREYDALAYAIDKAYGADKQELIKKQIALKERELQLARDRYMEYKNEYDSTVSLATALGAEIDWNEDWLAEMEEAHTEYEDLQRQLQDLKDAAVDAIFGEDIQSAIQNFADALTDAWDQGKDASETARDFINNMVRDMIKQALLSSLENSGMMRQLRSMLEMWIRSLNLGVQNAPGVVLRSIENIGESIVNEGVRRITVPTLDDIYNLGEEWAEALSNSNFAEWWRTMTEQIEGDRTAGTRGIAQASQESVDELNGRMTAVQGHTFQINESTLLIRDNVSAILGSVQRIEANTEQLHQMSRDIHSIKSVMDNADTLGLRIRS